MFEQIKLLLSKGYRVNFTTSLKGTRINLINPKKKRHIVTIRNTAPEARIVLELRKAYGKIELQK